MTSLCTEQEMVDALTAIPSIALTVDQRDFTSANGIFVNSGQRGREWERPAVVEFIYPDGVTQDLQIDCGLRTWGFFNRITINHKPASRLFFSKEYGVLDTAISNVRA